MKLNNLEVFLNALGYVNGEIINMQVNETHDGCDISFHLNKVTDPVMIDYGNGVAVEAPVTIQKHVTEVQSTPEKVEVEERKDIHSLGEPFEDYLKRNAEKLNKEISEKYEEPPKERTDDNYNRCKNRSVWKTPVPITRSRYIYFKSSDVMNKFIKEYESEFEIRKTDISHGVKVVPYITKANTDQNELYKMGYKWFIKFCMNGAAFEVLENCENLIKMPNGKAGGRCIRLKEGF